MTLFDEVLEMAKQKHKVMVEAAKRAAHDPPKLQATTGFLHPQKLGVNLYAKEVLSVTQFCGILLTTRSASH